MLSESFLKIATAAMSREISQIHDYDGVFKDRFERLRSSGFAANIQPAALPLANLRLLRNHRRALKGRRFNVQ